MSTGSGSRSLSMVLMLLMLVSPVLSFGAGEVSAESKSYPEIEYVREYEIPTPHALPVGITVSEDGSIWFAETGAAKIATFSPKTETFVEYDIPIADTTSDSPDVWSMAFDGAGHLWFTDATNNAVWRFDPVLGSFQKYPLPSERAFPMDLVIDAYGSVWIAELYASRVARLTPSHVEPNSSAGIWESEMLLVKVRSAGVVNETIVPSGVAGIALDDRGAVWITEPFGNKIAKLDPSSEEFTEYLLPRRTSSLVGITVASNGDLWIADHGSSKFFSIDGVDFTFTEYATSPAPSYPVSLPYWVRTDSEGNVWLNEHAGNKIAKFNPERMTLVEYEIPTRNPRAGNISNTLQFAVGPDDKVWFTEFTGNKIGMVDPALPLPFSIVSSRTHLTLVPGGSANVELLITAARALESPIILSTSASTTPSDGIRTFLSEESIALEGTDSRRIILRISTEEDLEPSRYTVRVGGTYGSVTQSVQIVLNIGGKDLRVQETDKHAISIKGDAEEGNTLLFPAAIAVFAASIGGIAFVVFRRRSSNRSRG